MSLDISFHKVEEHQVYSRNITHNLGGMAREAGVYDCLWHPEENGFKLAEQLIQPLKDALQALETDPERFKKLNPANGWGDYSGFVAFIKDVLSNAEEHPDARIDSWI